MANSKRKGKVGELEIAHILQERGYQARRGQQFSGQNGDADVVGLDGFHIEVKRREKADIYSWLAQSEAEAVGDEVPIVVFRKSHDKWRVIIGLDDFLDLLERAKMGKNEEITDE